MGKWWRNVRCKSPTSLGSRKRNGTCCTKRIVCFTDAVMIHFIWYSRKGILKSRVATLSDDQPSEPHWSQWAQWSQTQWQISEIVGNFRLYNSVRVEFAQKHFSSINDLHEWMIWYHFYDYPVHSFWEWGPVRRAGFENTKSTIFRHGIKTVFQSNMMMWLFTGFYRKFAKMPGNRWPGCPSINIVFMI